MKIGPIERAMTTEDRGALHRRSIMAAKLRHAEQGDESPLDREIRRQRRLFAQKQARRRR
jgi:hypothetical protein